MSRPFVIFRRPKIPRPGRHWHDSNTHWVQPFRWYKINFELRRLLFHIIIFNTSTIDTGLFARQRPWSFLSQRASLLDKVNHSSPLCNTIGRQNTMPSRNISTGGLKSDDHLNRSTPNEIKASHTNVGLAFEPSKVSHMHRSHSFDSNPVYNLYPKICSNVPCNGIEYDSVTQPDCHCSSDICLISNHLTGALLTLGDSKLFSSSNVSCSFAKPPLPPSQISPNLLRSSKSCSCLLSGNSISMTGKDSLVYRNTNHSPECQDRLTISSVNLNSVKRGLDNGERSQKSTSKRRRCY